MVRPVSVVTYITPSEKRAPMTPGFARVVRSETLSDATRPVGSVGRTCAVVDAPGQMTNKDSDARTATMRRRNFYPRWLLDLFQLHSPAPAKYAIRWKTRSPRWRKLGLRWPRW
ncbi:hypothetical protein BH20ACT23_BH20ACT23_10000 [soil metagenome]